MDEAIQEELKRLLELAEKYGLEQLSVATDDTKLEVTLDPDGIVLVPTALAGQQAASVAQAPEAIPANWKAVTSPLLGTYYRKPAPEAPPFVEIGDEVDVDTVVGLVEAMKVFNEVVAEVKGRVARVASADSTLVQPGDVLLWIEED
jgi:acetyl-CoA carboxylase biotin carboxyl carrier protein